jgi:glutamate/aspartate transport system substrate-binding protein
VETDRAAAFFMDDILLYSLAANSRNSSDYAISEEGYGVEPYGIMVRRDDPEFKAVADAAISELYASDEFPALYEKWFQQPIPPQGVTLNVPMSAALQGVVENPTDSADPADYQ